LKKMVAGGHHLMIHGNFPGGSGTAARAPLSGEFCGTLFLLLEDFGEIFSHSKNAFAFFSRFADC